MIKTYGIEIEGGIRNWSDVFNDEELELHNPIIRKWSLVFDGSVNLDDDPDVPHTEACGGPFKSIMEAIEAYKILYRLLTETNESCGTHIHVGIKRKYGIYYNLDFVKYFAEQYKSKFTQSKYRDRLYRDYCMERTTDADLVAQIFCKTGASYKNEARYRMVNFPFLYHKTIEFRVFPHITIGDEYKSVNELQEILCFVDNTMEAYAKGKSQKFESREEVDINTPEPQEIII